MERVIKILAVLILFGCNQYDFIEEDHNAKNRLIANIEIGKNDVINLIDLLHHEFDTVFIFKPYTPLKTIKGLKYVNIDCTKWYNDQIKKSKNAEVNEDINLIIFTSKNKIVSYFTFPRKIGDFSENRQVKFSFGNAVFLVKNVSQDNGTNWVRLLHIEQ